MSDAEVRGWIPSHLLPASALGTVWDPRGGAGPGSQSCPPCPLLLSTAPQSPACVSAAWAREEGGKDIIFFAFSGTPRPRRFPSSLFLHLIGHDLVTGLRGCAGRLGQSGPCCPTVHTVVTWLFSPDELWYLFTFSCRPHVRTHALRKSRLLVRGRTVVPSLQLRTEPCGCC